MSTNSHTCLKGLFGFVVLLMAVSAQAGNDPDGSVLPRHPIPYRGSLEPTESASTPDYPVSLYAPAEAPNILLVLTDDVGFAASSTFGGPVPTPHLDRLAENGLRYNRFHTTAVCSPTRAALLTGRNHHTVGMGSLVEMNAPYPGYTGVIPPTTATIARVLRDNGYNTAMFGKEHNVLSRERSAAGPFHNWPTGRGFEYFFGFLGGDTNQWQPALFEGITPIDSRHRPDNYLLDEQMADRAIHWIHNQKAAAPDKPFFIYYAPGSAHAPHQAPMDWITSFKGKFDHGWDREREQIFARQKAAGVIPPDAQLTPRPDFIPAWNSLSDNERRVFARFMEVFAAHLAFQDAQIGRILDELSRMGIADNTLVVFIEGDNGSSGEGALSGSVNEITDLASPAIEHDIDVDWLADNLDVLGGPRSYQTYPVGWTYAMSTPFPWFKQMASHLGGTRNGLVVTWPEGMRSRGEVRRQYHHVIDIMPTLLQAAGVVAPTTVDGIEQLPLDGSSMVYSFDGPDRPSRRHTQYYEINSNRAVYHEGWLAATTPRTLPWVSIVHGGDGNVMDLEWELYDLRSDYSQADNLAREKPQKLREMQAVFDQEARKFNVYPIQDSGAVARSQRMRLASKEPFRTEYTYWGRDIQLSMDASPPIFFLPFSISAEVEIPEEGGEGVIVAAGSYFGGWSFYLDEGRPVALTAVSPLQGRQYSVSGPGPLSPGHHLLRFDFEPGQNGGIMTVFVDGEQVARDTMPERPQVMAGNGETFDIGRDTRTPVSTDYQDEGEFNGRIRKIQASVSLPKIPAAAQP